MKDKIIKMKNLNFVIYNNNKINNNFNYNGDNQIVI